MSTAPPAMGLYSIGVRDLAPEQLLPWARDHAIPFLHLRGGARGHRLSQRTAAQVGGWRALADRTVPVTAVTADVELADLLAGDPSAATELAAVAEHGRSLGAPAVRVLATTPPASWSPPGRTAELRGRPLLIELHSRDWFTPEALGYVDRLLGSLPRAALLVDSLCFERCAPAPDRALADWLIDRSIVVHLSDHGEGFSAPGHRLLLRSLHGSMHRSLRDGTGPGPELAFEWTGADRSPAACLARYRQAVAWVEATW
ncbi:hypothetical protein [Kitasatospora mediocidica]|uniref:hypothetical protein n=1 Tax=Kitasatospora mediocidica TaxID=58352 RepID=UPI000690DD66|nr:hypothetical protein [Kitasatospora mediocidica]